MTYTLDDYTVVATQAIKHQNLDVLCYLLQFNLDTQNLITVAVENNSTQVIEYFMDKGLIDNVNNYSCLALKYRHGDLIKYFINKGASKFWLSMYDAMRKLNL